VKTMIIALSAAALITAVPVGFAQSSETPALQHKLLKKRSAGLAGHQMKARASNKGYPGAFGYAPSEPRDYVIEMSRQAGGGGGGGGGGSGM
jgi:hypothetical protein